VKPFHRRQMAHQAVAHSAISIRLACRVSGKPAKGHAHQASSLGKLSINIMLLNTIMES